MTSDPRVPPPVTDTTREFAATAAAFCAWCTGPAGDPEAELRAAIRHLSRLYALAQDLPVDEDAADIDGVSCDDEQWQTVYRRFAVLPFGYYAEVLDPHRIDEPETALGDVADDLADIFRDVDEGLGLFRAGQFDAAVWHWAFTFRIHWGEHVVGALSALHQWRRDEVGDGTGPPG